MFPCSRRDFLVRSATTAGLCALPAGSLLAEAAKPRDMTIARWAGPQPEPGQLKDIAVKLTEKAIEELGGMKRFVKNGDVVWVKPNIGWDRTPERPPTPIPTWWPPGPPVLRRRGPRRSKWATTPATRPSRPTKPAASPRPPGRREPKCVFLDRSRFKDTAIKRRAGKNHADLSRVPRVRPGDQRSRSKAPRLADHDACA